MSYHDKRELTRPKLKKNYLWFGRKYFKWTLERRIKCYSGNHKR